MVKKKSQIWKKKNLSSSKTGDSVRNAKQTIFYFWPHLILSCCMTKTKDMGFTSRKRVRVMKTPYTPLLCSKTGVYRGIHYFLIFALNIYCGYSLEPPL